MMLYDSIDQPLGGRVSQPVYDRHGLGVTPATTSCSRRLARFIGRRMLAWLFSVHVPREEPWKREQKIDRPGGQQTA